MTEVSAAALNAEADRLEAAAEASFDRCGDDGMLTQWSLRLNARLKRRQAALIEAGGTEWFRALTDATTGEWVPSKLIAGRYGPCWALLDDDGGYTGQFITAFPKQEQTMTRKGFRERWGRWPAKAFIDGEGSGLSGQAWVAVKKDCGDLMPPLELADEPDQGRP